MMQRVVWGWGDDSRNKEPSEAKAWVGVHLWRVYADLLGRIGDRPPLVISVKHSHQLKCSAEGKQYKGKRRKKLLSLRAPGLEGKMESKPCPEGLSRSSLGSKRANNHASRGHSKVVETWYVQQVIPKFTYTSSYYFGLLSHEDAPFFTRPSASKKITTQWRLR